MSICPTSVTNSSASQTTSLALHEHHLYFLIFRSCQRRRHARRPAADDANDRPRRDDDNRPRRDDDTRMGRNEYFHSAKHADMVVRHQEPTLGKENERPIIHGRRNGWKRREE